MAVTKLFNPLDEFNSYSVHYVMLACRTTVDAQDFIDESKNAATLAAIEEVKFLGEPVPYGDRKDTAFLVMDTRRFSQFTVERLKYDALINGLEQGGSHGNLVTTLEMTILDSVGISFINFLQWLMDAKMQCNFDGMVYMLRVIFVGHDADTVAGTVKTEMVQSVTIPMHLLSLELNLDYAKGAYTAEFMPNINFDAKANSRWLAIGTATHYSTGDNTLGSLITSFESELNKRSEAYFMQASKLLENVANRRGVKATNDSGKYGRLVKYMITIPEEWTAYKFEGRSDSKSTEIVFAKEPAASSTSAPAKTGTSGTPTSSNLAVNTGMIITDVLDKMFKQVPQVADLGNGRKTEGTGGSVSFYKYLVGITSDNDNIIVHIDVIPFRVPNVVLEKAKQEKVSQGDTEFYVTLPSGERIPRNYMEFDYIFTGKNTSILNFDMKLQNLQWMLASNLEMGPGAMADQSLLGQDGKKLPVNGNAELVTSRPYDALLMPKNTAAELNNFSDYSTHVLNSERGKELMKGRQDYTRNLSAFYAASPITVAMTIKGNPDIMTKFNMGTFLPHTPDATNAGGAQSKKQYRKTLEDKIIRDNTSVNGNTAVKQLAVEQGVVVVKSLGDTSYAAQPVFVKVNINGPNADFRTSEMVEGQDFSKAVLENNFYVVFKVTNLIENGMFTQDLELYSHNIFGQGKMAGAPGKAVETKA